MEVVRGALGLSGALLLDLNSLGISQTIQIACANYPGMTSGFPNKNDLNLATTIILVLLQPISPQKPGEN